MPMIESSDGDVTPDFLAITLEILTAYGIGVGCFFLVFLLMVGYHQMLKAQNTMHQEGELDLIIR